MNNGNSGEFMSQCTNEGHCRLHDFMRRGATGRWEKRGRVGEGGLNFPLLEICPCLSPHTISFRFILPVHTYSLVIIHCVILLTFPSFFCFPHFPFIVFTILSSVVSASFFPFPAFPSPPRLYFS